MTNITERLSRVQRELAAIAVELAAQVKGRQWQPGPRAALMLAALQAYIAEQGGVSDRFDCVYYLTEQYRIGRSAAYEHIARLVKHGRLVPDATGERLSLPKTAADLL